MFHAAHMKQSKIYFVTVLVNDVCSGTSILHIVLKFNDNL
jgi:hypothetical protein